MRASNLATNSAICSQPRRAMEIAKSEHHRRTQVCGLRDLLEVKDKDVERMKVQLHVAEDRVSGYRFRFGY
jgi:hypothetical protein